MSQKYKFDPTIIAGNFPPELLALKRFVVWTVETRGGKATKVPYSGLLSHRAKANSPETWHTFAAACQFARILSAKNPKKTIGIGFQFFDLTDFFGIDLDKCRDPATGAIEPWAEKIIADFPTYGEISTSGTGIHLIGIGKKPGPRCRNQRLQPGLEIYGNGSGRFFVVTGNRIAGNPAATTDCQVPLRELYLETFGEDPPPRQAFDDDDGDDEGPPPDHRPPGDPHDPDGGCCRKPACEKRATRPRHPRFAPDDQKIFSAIRDQRDFSKAAKFFRLFSGDTSDCGGDDSRADYHLCQDLAYWVGPDPARIESLFRQSVLARRDKWGRADYRNRTIKRAIASRSTFKEWPAQPIAPQEDAESRSSSFHTPQEQEERTATQVGDELFAGITNPGVDHVPYKCRKVAIAITRRDNPGVRKFARFACRRHDCPACKQSWEKNRQNWFLGIIRQFKEIHSVTTSTAAESAAVRQQITRKTAKGEAPVYARFPGQDDRVLWITNCPVKGSERITLDEAEHLVIDAIHQVPPTKRIGCTRAIAYRHAKDPPTGEWKRDSHQPAGLSRMDMSKARKVTEEMVGKENVTYRENIEKDSESLEYRVGPDWTARDQEELYRKIIPGYFGPAPVIRIRPRAERAVLVLNSPTPTPTG